MKRWFGVVWLCWLAAACGAMGGSVRAPAQVYDVSYGQVWAAALTEVRARYSHLAVEAPTTGTIVTEWAWYGADGSRRPEESLEGDALFRLKVQVVERAHGWAVQVDGDSELVDRERASAVIPSEPPAWVHSEIAAVQRGIHRRLGGDHAL